MSLPKDVYDPSAKPLDPAELGVALRNNQTTHREFIREQVDQRIADQEWGNIAFNFLETPLMLPDNQPFYGWFKLRGAFPNEDQAVKHIERLLQYHDSKSKNWTVPMGKWVPLTSSKLLTKQFHEVSNDEWRKNEAKTLAREREQIAEIRAREEQLKKGVTEYTEDSLDYYITKKVTLAENEYTQKRAKETLRQTEKNLDSLRKELAELDTKYPEHKKQALGRYNQEREAAGLEAVKNFGALERS